MEMHTLPSSGFPGERHIILESWADHTVTSCCFCAALSSDFSSSVMSFPAQAHTALSDCCAAESTQHLRHNRPVQPCLRRALHSKVLVLAQHLHAACGQLGLTNIEGLGAEGGSSVSVSVSVPVHSA